MKREIFSDFTESSVYRLRFDLWGEALTYLDEIYDCDLGQELADYLNEYFPGGLELEELNDLFSYCEIIL